jgi:hypothetical protein
MGLVAFVKGSKTLRMADWVDYAATNPAFARPIPR